MYNKYHAEFEQRRMNLLRQGMWKSAPYASKALKEDALIAIKIDFNDIAMRELGLGITDDDKDHVYDMDTNSILQLNGKFIKYSDAGFVDVRADEIDLNLIEDVRLFEKLFAIWAAKRIPKMMSFSQDAIRGSNKGVFSIKYEGDKGMAKEIKSDAFENESVRIFNAICKINHTAHIYKLDRFDIKIPKKKV